MSSLMLWFWQFIHAVSALLASGLRGKMCVTLMLNNYFKQALLASGLRGKVCVTLLLNNYFTQQEK